MTRPNLDSLGSLAGLALPPLTDHPVQLGRLAVDAHWVTVWADRPARGLTRIMLVDEAGLGCGDATLQGDTLTVTVPGTWAAVDRASAMCLIAGLVYQGGVRGCDRCGHCQRHAEQFPAGEAPHGPDIVELGSARHAELLADPDNRTG
ncbi:hypothetical protein [Dactylosporangium darangshiense]|uniref:Uncharacterized protein n=1 Tax=Dactylosporangium darangshiense TaxID=579108 RepID=A0ABP8DN56_9ACTN